MARIFFHLAVLFIFTLIINKYQNSCINIRTYNMQKYALKTFGIESLLSWNGFVGYYFLCTINKYA